MSTTPIFDAVSEKHPEAIEAMARERWSFEAASAAADAAIAARKAKRAATAAKRRAVKKVSRNEEQ